MWEGASPVKKNWELSQEDFDRLLAWLDNDRERAGEKYEEIRRKLIKMFACRGCHAPEELADETINRVTSKVKEIAADYQGEPANYFYRVAKVIHLEYVRTRHVSPPPPSVYHAEEEREADDRLYDCLERCLAALDPNSGSIFLDYHKYEKQAKVEHRKEMAAKLGISGVALRLRVCRIRASLLLCVVACLSEGEEKTEPH
jgi:DNA-directed RNA polymerase specialized sigma24 family protein